MNEIVDKRHFLPNDLMERALSFVKESIEVYIQRRTDKDTIKEGIITEDMFFHLIYAVSTHPDLHDKWHDIMSCLLPRLDVVYKFMFDPYDDQIRKYIYGIDQIPEAKFE